MLVDGIEFARRFGDNNDVGTITSPPTFAEVAERQDVVVAIGLAIFGEEDVDGGLDVAVLVDIVEHNHLGWLGLLQKFLHPDNTFFTHRHLDIGELGRHHGRLVTEAGGAVAAVVEQKAVCPAMITPTEQGSGILVGQQAQEVFDMGCLARPAGTDVAHTDGSDVGRYLTREAYVEKEVAEPNANGIPHSQWEK